MHVCIYVMHIIFGFFVCMYVRHTQISLVYSYILWLYTQVPLVLGAHCAILYWAMHVCMYACMYIHTYACMRVCMFVFVCMYVCMHVCMYACMYVCMYAYKYILVCGACSWIADAMFCTSMYPCMYAQSLQTRVSGCYYGLYT